MAISKVDPIIIYPFCIENGLEQDCLKCGRINLCDSPRSMCVKPYHNHPKGCPNYGKKVGCPPSIEMFDQVYDMDKDVYAIITSFDIKSHLVMMKELHPDWTHYQLINSRCWQGKDRANHKMAIKRFNDFYPEYIVTTWPEGMGVNLVRTMDQIGIKLEFPVQDLTYRISLAGIIPEENLDRYDLCVREGTYKEKVLSKRLH